MGGRPSRLRTHPAIGRELHGLRKGFGVFLAPSHRNQVLVTPKQQSPQAQRVSKAFGMPGRVLFQESSRNLLVALARSLAPWFGTRESVKHTQLTRLALRGTRVAHACKKGGTTALASRHLGGRSISSACRAAHHSRTVVSLVLGLDPWQLWKWLRDPGGRGKWLCAVKEGGSCVDPNGTWNPDKAEWRHALSLIPASGAMALRKWRRGPWGPFRHRAEGSRRSARGRAGGRAVCVWFLPNHWLACVVQAGLGLGGCGALECESGAQPPAAAGPQHLW